jgi:hypothetical protein
MQAAAPTSDEVGRAFARSVVRDDQTIGVLVVADADRPIGMQLPILVEEVLAEQFVETEVCGRRRAILSGERRLCVRLSGDDPEECDESGSRQLRHRQPHNDGQAGANVSRREA